MCQTQGPRAYSGPPHHFMWPARAFDCLKKIKIKTYMLLYIVNYESAYQYHKFLFLFGILFIRINWLWCPYDTQWLWIRGVGVFRWWRLRGGLKGIKRTSSSARAPPTEKHDILHSFNELKKSMEALRHDFLLLFLWSYFNDKCPERIIACKSANLSAGRWIPIHSHRKRTRSLSVRHYMCALKNYLLSWI